MEFNLQALVRPNIWSLEPYSCARREFTGQAGVWLNANESAYNTPYNRYPDPIQAKVKDLLAKVKGVDASRIFLGVGSDECIDAVYRVFCRPGIDRSVVLSPSYDMYKVCADINDVKHTKVTLRDDFSLDLDAMRTAMHGAKVIWLCSPNNPTGNSIPTADMVTLCREFDGIVVVDEAYIDYSSQPSMTEWLDEFPNLIVLQTLSKAWGSAAVRLGIAYASAEIIELFNRVKYPYNISELIQRYAIDRLGQADEVHRQVATALELRSKLISDLEALPQVLHVFPSDANFVLVRVSDADGIYNSLLAEGIIVRNRSHLDGCKGCLRITVGTEAENDAVIKGIAKYGN